MDRLVTIKLKALEYKDTRCSTKSLDVGIWIGNGSNGEQLGLFQKSPLATIPRIMG